MKNLEEVGRVGFRWIRRRVGGQAIFDSFSWIVAVFLAGAFRYEFALSAIDVEAFFFLGVFLAAVGFFAGKTVSLYRSRYKTASFDELGALLTSTAMTSVPFAAGLYLFGTELGIPRSVVFIATPIFLLTSGAARTVRRFYRATSQKPLGAKRALVYGAGRIAETLIPQLLQDPNSQYLPVGLMDDDPQQSNRWIAGVKMQGPFDNLESIVGKTGAQAVIVAIPRATSEILRKIRELASSLGLEILVLPSFSEILASSGRDIVLRELGIEDLVGRRAVSINSPQVASLISGKVVLITGAGGSIGLELSKQVAAFNPHRLIFLDRDETGLQHAQLGTQKSGLLDSADVVLADIRDCEAIGSIFARHKPDVVFHAAALKHLPVLENFPSEAWKTNVQGTLNVLKAAQKAGVGTFVNISTDKAADPSSVLGRSKRLAEELTAWASLQGEGRYLSVRFGNVLGSRGSLVPTLAHLINNGDPITITHPDATRYFMTSAEAGQLVLQAGTETEKSSIFVLDMGKAVRIMDVAERMIEMSGKTVDILYTGLRPGEKLHEVLYSGDDWLLQSNHELIWRLFSAHRDPTELPGLHDSFHDGTLAFPGGAPFDDGDVG
jgi:dTDP-glucose 4,6-dehydratase